MTKPPPGEDLIEWQPHEGIRACLMVSHNGAKECCTATVEDLRRAGFAPAPSLIENKHPINEAEAIPVAPMASGEGTVTHLDAYKALHVLWGAGDGSQVLKLKAYIDAQEANGNALTYWSTRARELDETRQALQRRVAQLEDQNDPQWDCTDAAHPAWWRGHDNGAKGMAEVKAKLERRVEELTEERRLLRVQACYLVIECDELRAGLDPRPRCIKCDDRWVPDEGVDATVIACLSCSSPAPIATPSPDSPECVMVDRLCEALRGVADADGIDEYTVRALRMLARNLGER